MILNSGHKKSKNPAAAMAQLPSEIRKKEISDRLKIVDKLIKDGNLDEAADQLETVKALAPKNGYVLALEERIGELREARSNPQVVEARKANDETPPENKIEQMIDTDYLAKIDEEVHKVEERLESEYRERYAEEIGRYEEQMAELLKQADERENAERSALIVDFDKQREGFLEELKKETRRLLVVEFAKADEVYRKMLADGIRESEEKIRVELTARYEKAISEFKESTMSEKSHLLDAERNALIEETRKRTQDELQKRFMDELAKVRDMFLSISSNQGDESGKPVKREMEKESEAITKAAGRQAAEDETESEARYNRLVAEDSDVQEKSVREDGRKDQEHKTEAHNAAVEKGQEAQIKIKSDDELARDMELHDRVLGKEFKSILGDVSWKDRSRKKKG